jgi:hypothetical protein
MLKVSVCRHQSPQIHLSPSKAAAWFSNFNATLLPFLESCPMLIAEIYQQAESPRKIGDF